MTLFDDVHQRDVRPKRNSESTFEYLNQSGRPPYAVMRGLLEQWYSRIPDTAKTDLRARFRSSTDSQHQGAFFELYIHELLTCCGLRLEVHPEVPGTAKHPDYVAMRQGERQFYVEATLALPSREEEAADKRAARVYDALNDKVESPNFFLAIRIRGAPSTPPPGRKLAKALTGWLRTMDPDVLGEVLRTEGFDGLPSFDWSHDDWELSFLPVAKSPALRGAPGVRPIGITMPEVQILETHKAIHAAVCNKATRYGSLDLPYLVAVNVVADHVDTIDVMNALFGEEYVQIWLKADGWIAQAPGRKRDGAWFGPTGPRNTRVSGVIVLKDLTQWTVHQAPVLIHNPYATKPFPVDRWPLPQRVPDDQEARLADRPGVDVVDLLRLPQPWPPTDGSLGQGLPIPGATDRQDE